MMDLLRTCLWSHELFWIDVCEAFAPGDRHKHNICPPEYFVNPPWPSPEKELGRKYLSGLVWDPPPPSCRMFRKSGNPPSELLCIHCFCKLSVLLSVSARPNSRWSHYGKVDTDLPILRWQLPSRWGTNCVRSYGVQKIIFHCGCLSKIWSLVDFV